MRKAVGFIFPELKNREGAICFPELGIHKIIAYDEQGKIVEVKTIECDQNSENHKNGDLLFGDSESLRKILEEITLCE